MARVGRKRISGSSDRNISTQLKNTTKNEQSQPIEKNMSFSNQLSRVDEAISVDGVSIFDAQGIVNEAVLQELQDTIHSIGDALLSNPRIDTALQYKEAIQKLLKSVVPYLHKKDEIVVRKGIMTANGPDMREYKFTVISKINQQLDDVLKIILGTQVDQLMLMKSLDEMKGLIVDLLQ